MRPGYPPEVQGLARALRRSGLSPKPIASRLGIPYSTVYRWLNPAYYERNLAVSREAKRRRTGTCIDCGGVTRYAGGNGNAGLPVALRCAPCDRAASRFWTRDRIIDAIQRWAAERGRPPHATDWIRAAADGSHPSASNVFRTRHPSARNHAFASWAEAIEAAGFPRPYSPPGPGNQLFDRDQARRLRAQGVADTEIARRYGVTPGAIYAALGARREAA